MWLCLSVLDRKALVQSWPLVSTLLLCLALWTVISVIPLPLAFIDHASPAAAILWRNTFTHFQPNTGWATLSIDPVASWHEAAKWSCYTLAAAHAARRARSNGSCREAATLVSAACLMVCLVTWAHYFVGAKTVFGFYHPKALSADSPIGPLLNPNNLAGVANLGTFCALGRLKGRDSLIPKPLIAISILVGISTVFLSGSRGGLASLAVGGLIAAYLWSPAESATWSKTQRSLAAGAIGIVLSAVIWVRLKPQFAGKLLADDLAKLSGLADIAPAAKDYWAFGIGRGAFETLSEQYWSEGYNVVAQKVENLPLSWMVEWGLPVSLLAFAGVFYCMRPGRLAWLSPSARMVWTALVVVALQNLVDLGLELSALGVCVSYLLGALGGSHSSSKAAEQKLGQRRRLHRTRRTTLLYATTGLTCLFGISIGYMKGPDVMTLRENYFRELSEMTPEKYDAFSNSLAQELLRRPAEPYFPMLGAQAALVSGRDGLTWSSRALERAPHNGRVHYLTALALRQKNKTIQALFELKLAITYAPRLTESAMNQAFEWTDSPGLLERIVPDGVAGADVLRRLAGRLPQTQRETRYRFLDRALVRAPQDRATTTQIANNLIEELRAEDKLDQEKLKRLRNLAEELSFRHSLSCDGPRIMMNVDNLLGLSATKIAKRSDDCEACSESAQCYRTALQILGDTADKPTIEKLEELYLGRACQSSRSCERAESWIAERSAARGSAHRAYRFYVRAARRANSGPLWRAAGKSAISASRFDDATRALDYCETLGGDVTSLRSRLEEQKLKAPKRSFP